MSRVNFAIVYEKVVYAKSLSHLITRRRDWNSLTRQQQSWTLRGAAREKRILRGNL